jgi:hypothetical protein
MADNSRSVRTRHQIKKPALVDFIVVAPGDCVRGWITVQVALAAIPSSVAFTFPTGEGGVVSFEWHLGDVPLDGNLAIVTNSGTCLNVRDRPSTSGKAIACLKDGVVVAVLGDAGESDGYAWLEVEHPEGRGYAVATYLRPY